MTLLAAVFKPLAYAWLLVIVVVVLGFIRSAWKQRTHPEPYRCENGRPDCGPAEVRTEDDELLCRRCSRGVDPMAKVLLYRAGGGK